MGSIRRKAHILPQNAHSIGQYSSGAMDESSGKGSKVQAHMSSGVFMDNAALKVGHSVGSHQDAATLQAEKRST